VGGGTTTSTDVLVEPIAGSGELLRVQFRLLDPTASAAIELLGVSISDPVGRITVIRSDQVAEFRSLPDRFELSQNFPNPFNPETVVPFSVPESGALRLSIFNVLGQEVAVLVDGDVQAGFHRIVWDGKDRFGRSVASGLYFVRMHSDVFSSVRKMMFLK
jgi:flagellar hook assembly protein FlgD